MLGPFNDQPVTNNLVDEDIDYSKIQIIDLDNNIEKDATDKILEDPVPISKSSNIFVNFEKDNNTFNIYNNKKDKIGFFTLDHLVKYILDNNGTYNDKQTDYELSKDLIKTFIIKDLYNNELYDYNESSLMGDLNILIRINTLLEKTSKSTLDDILIDTENKQVLKDKFNNIRSKFMSNTLKNISEIKNNNNDNINNRLIKYSTKLLNDIIDITREKINTYQQENTKITDTLTTCKQLRELTSKKLDNIDSLLVKQNNNLTQMTETINKYKMHGGRRIKVSESYDTADETNTYDYETDSYEEISIEDETDSYSDYYTQTSSNKVESTHYKTSETSMTSNNTSRSSNTEVRRCDVDKINGIYEL